MVSGRLKYHQVAVLGLLPALFACSEDAVDSPATETRWYTATQVEAGAEVFANHCAQCHGPDAEGLVENWRQRQPDGSFPAPPLNGSAHAWHHPLPVLLQVIDSGGIPFGGQMPAFANVLSQQEKLAVIAWFQEYWTDEIYAQWQQIDEAN